MRKQINLLEVAGFGKPPGVPSTVLWSSLASLVLIFMFGALAFKEGARGASMKAELEGLRQRRTVMMQEQAGAKTQIGAADPIPLFRPVRWSVFMREISRIIPEGIWMKRWEGTASDGKESQVRISGGASTYDELVFFLSALGRANLVSEANLISAKRTETEVQFEILVGLKGEREK